MFVAVHFLTVPTAKRDHDGAHSRFNDCFVGSNVEFPKGGFVTDGVALVPATFRAAVAGKMLGASEHRPGVEPVALKSANRSHAELGDQFGGLAETLVAASPADVAGHGNTG